MLVLSLLLAAAAGPLPPRPAGRMSVDLGGVDHTSAQARSKLLTQERCKREGADGAAYCAMLGEHAQLTAEEMREYLASDPAVPGPHDRAVLKVLRKDKVFKAKWTARCNPERSIVLPSGQQLEPGEIPHTAGRRERLDEEGEVPAVKRHKKHRSRLVPGKPVWIEEDFGRHRRELHVVIANDLPLEREAGAPAQFGAADTLGVLVESLDDHKRRILVPARHAVGLSSQFADEVNGHLCRDDASEPCGRCRALVRGVNLVATQQDPLISFRQCWRALANAEAVPAAPRWWDAVLQDVTDKDVGAAAAAADGAAAATDDSAAVHNPVRRAAARPAVAPFDGAVRA